MDKRVIGIAVTLWVISSFTVLRAKEASEAVTLDDSDILSELAKSTNDSRTIEQILKDNAMIRSASKGDTAAVAAALKNGALVNSRYLDSRAFLDNGSTGYTALMLASRDGHIEVVKELIKQGADLNLERNGRTSLYIAVLVNQNAVVDLLEKAGAGDSKKIRLRLDLLRAACEGFQLEQGDGFPLYPGVVQNLELLPETGLREIGAHSKDGAKDLKKVSEITKALRQGADVNSADANGYTALMYAANLGLTENVAVLLEHGADAKLTSNRGETALWLAERPESSVAHEGRQKVVEILKAHLATKK